MTISFQDLRTVSGAIKFTHCSKSKHEPVAKISAAKSKASRHEKSLKQSTLIIRWNNSEQYTTVLKL